MITPSDFAKRQLTLWTDRIHALPVVVLMPHSRCNCRCVMCDIWKGNKNRQELGHDDLAHHLEAFRRWRVRWVVFSGGEALMHSNLWTLCELLKELGVRISLLSTGLLLTRNAEAITRWCDDVIVSLDGAQEIHDQIRRVPRAYAKLAEGVQALRDQRPGFPVSGRSVLQRQNFRDLPAILDAARDLGLDRISFLAADVSSEAFNRPGGWDEERTDDVALSKAEAAELEEILERTFESHADDFRSGFVAESPSKMRRLAQYFRATAGDGDFPTVRCNAPWVSTVIEADGAVRPCFFHPVLGNLHEQPLPEILNSPEAVRFRRQLDVASDPICRRCVCALNLGPFE